MWSSISSPEARNQHSLTVLRLGLSPVVGEEAIARAVALARSAQTALLFVGRNGEWDGEGLDRTNIDLPHRQNELISRVAAANKNTVVVLQSGSPVAMPWLDQVAAVIQAWYPGQEAGNSIADVLLGKAEPGGRLPQTFPRRLEDDPAFINYPGEGGHVRYGEGLYVGYRYYEKKKIEPLFPFGFGLSYTQFRFGALTLSAGSIGPGETIEASIEVANVGDREGSTVVQFYVVDEQASVSRPDKELKRFVKARLAAGREANDHRDLRHALPGVFRRRDEVLEGRTRSLHGDGGLLQRRHPCAGVLRPDRHMDRRQSAPQRGQIRLRRRLFRASQIAPRNQ